MVAPIPLTQYWHDGQPPADVYECMGTWASDERIARQCFNFDSAETFIADNLSGVALRAFRSCVVPAMQADLLRYASLLVNGGAYADASMVNLGGAAALFDDCTRGRLFLREREGHSRVINSLMYARTAGDPFIERVLQTAIANILARSSNNAWAVSGPGVLTSIWKSAKFGASEILDGFRIEPMSEFAHAVEWKWLPYKGSETNWRRYLEMPVESLYR